MLRLFVSFFRKIVIGVIFFGNDKNYQFAKIFLSDALRYKKYIGSFNQNSEEFQQAKLTFDYHRLEKGLTMPDFRYGFGKAAVLETVGDIKRYKKSGFSVSNTAYKQAISVLKEYDNLHKSAEFLLDPLIQDALDSILEGAEVTPTIQMECTPEMLFKQSDASFEKFSESRHTVRHFDGRVEISSIRSAIELALNAPQACNRSFVRVHVYEGDKVQQLLALQNGNKGFGHRCEQLIVVSAKMPSLLFLEERYDLHTNAGIFIMNLSYALHYYHVAHCMLNWWFTKNKDRKLHEIGCIPDDEIAILLIACGKPANSFKIADSPKEQASHIATFH